MPRNSRGKRASRKGKHGSSSSSAGNRQVSMLPLTMRMIPATWNLAQLDSNPMATPKREQICTFRRTYTLASLQANTGDTLRAFNFTLGALPNSGDFTNLFDQYRILEAIVTFMPYSNVAASTSTSSAYPGLIGSWLDYDDANLPANLQEGQQYDSYQRNACTEPFDRVIKPKSAIAAYSGTFTSYDSVYGQWHDSNSPNIQHYGLKCAITGSTFATATNIYELEVTVTIQCKSQH